MTHKNGFRIVMAGLLGMGYSGAAIANPNPYAAWTETKKVDTIQLAQNDSAAVKTSGQGDYKFKVLYTSSHLPKLNADPATAENILKSAHGGFAVDRRPGKGEIYFALPGAGLMRISADLSKIDLIDTTEEVKVAALHNTAIWYDANGNAYLGFPSLSTNKIYVTDLNGQLLSTLDPPKGNEFEEKHVNRYFESGSKFIPTDLAELNGMLYITTGYSALDYVLTAKVGGTAPASLAWNPLAFGGKGNGPGQFQTGHGVTINPERNRVDVADRPVAELERFTPEGKYLETIKLPEAAYPCDIDFEGGYMLVGCLQGSNPEGAPIYLLKDDKVISTVNIRVDLGLPNFTHVHNSVMRVIDGKIYIIAQAWNPGDFAILEQVK